MIIRNVILSMLISMLLSGVSVLPAHAAGQIVTPEIREWAKKTVEGEKSLSASAADNALVVLYFGNRTGRIELDPLQKGMTLMLLTDLSQVPEMQLIERVRLQALAEELGLGSSGLVDQATAPRIGRLVGARFITGGDFVGGKEARFDTRSQLVDVPSSAITGQFSIAGTMEDILKTEKELAFGIVDKLKISLKPEVAAAIRKPCSTSLKALDALFRGVDASDRGDYQQAGELYSDALQADPDVCVASAALQELIRMGGYSDRGSSVRVKGKVGESAQGEAAQSAETPEEPFSLQSALAETALSVSSQTSLTNQILPKEVVRPNQPAIAEINTPKTPVTIRVSFP